MCRWQRAYSCFYTKNNNNNTEKNKLKSIKDKTPKMPNVYTALQIWAQLVFLYLLFGVMVCYCGLNSSIV
jgi:hypothetical protein